MDIKAAYQEKLEAQLREWSAGIEELKAEAAEVKADAKIQYSEYIDKLAAKQEAAKAKLQELRDGGEEAWEKLKPGLEQVWKDLKGAVDEARTAFK